MIKLELPYPPTINHYYSYQRGRPVLTKHAREYRQAVRATVIQTSVQPLLGPLAVRIDIFPPDQRRRDCDNVQKALLDALQHAGVFWDDSQIVWLLTVKSTPVTGGSVTVKIAPFDASSPLPNG